MNISSLQSLSAVTQANAAEQIGATSSKTPTGTGSVVAGSDTFAGFIQQFVQQSNLAQKAADASITDFVTGKSDNIQNVAIAMANAEMSFKFFMEIRNKVIESFNDLMRMPF